MQSSHPQRSSHCLGRRGMAPLEFVMALPVLLLLMVAIVWLGYFVIGQTEVIIEARNKAWKKRFENEKQVPLMFPVKLGDAENPEYAGDADFVTEEATTTVDISPAFKAFPQPKSAHMILAGSWDHRAMPFDKPPDLGLLKPVLINSVTAELQSLTAIVGNLEQMITDLAAEAAAQAAQSIAGAGFTPGGGGFDNMGSIDESRPDEGNRPPNGEEDQRTTQLRQQKAALEEELRQVNEEIEKLGDVKPNEPKDKLQQRQFLALKKQRIENNIRYVNKEIGDR